MVDEASSWTPKNVVQVNADSQVLTEKFTAIASQTLFKIVSFSYAPLTHSLLVFKNGTLMTPNVDVFEDNATQFHLSDSQAASVNDVIVAIGWVGVTGNTYTRDTDIFIASIAALKAYTGDETTIYLLGNSASKDGGEGWYTKITGAAIGTYIDNYSTDIILPTGGDGSIAWIKNARDNEWIRPTSISYLSTTSVTAIGNVADRIGLSTDDVGNRVKLLYAEGEARFATIASINFSGGNAELTLENITNAAGTAYTTIPNSTGIVFFSSMPVNYASPRAYDLPIPFAKAAGTVDALTLATIPAMLPYDGLTVVAELLGSITITTPTLALNGSAAVGIVKGDGAALDLADMAGANRRCLFSYDLAATKWVLLNPSVAHIPGVLVYLDAAQTFTTSVYAALLFDQESYKDVSNMHNNSTNTSRVVVPAGATEIELMGQVTFVSNATGARDLEIRKNGSSTYAGKPHVVVTNAGSGSPSRIQISSLPLVVVAGDYFELWGLQISGGNLDASGDTDGQFTWFGLKVIK